MGAFACFPFLTYDLPDTLELLCHFLVGSHDFIEGVGNLAFQSCPVPWEPHGKVAITHGLQASKYGAELGRDIRGKAIAMPVFLHGDTGVPILLSAYPGM